METKEWIKKHYADFSQVLTQLPVDNIDKLCQLLVDMYKNDNQLFTFGNGGYGSTASHVVNDFIKHTVVSDQKNDIVTNKRRVRAMCLCDNVSTLTAWANDTNFDNVFSEPLKNFVRPGDIVLGITGSGNSKNVLNAFEVAKQNKAVTVCLTGKGGGKAKDVADLVILIPSNYDAYIEDLHLSIMHLVCNILRDKIQNNQI
jgi:D-sedoheptulose 7-phosphate isomerase